MDARPLSPTYMAPCAVCGESTTHSGLTDERGRELGSFCLACDARRRNLERIARLYGRTVSRSELMDRR